MLEYIAYGEHKTIQFLWIENNYVLKTGCQTPVKNGTPTVALASGHRIPEWLRVAGMSGPTLLLKQSHVDLVSQDHVQMAFEYLYGWRLYYLSGQPVKGQTS